MIGPELVPGSHAREAVAGMRDLTLAMMRCSWAGALLGADRVADLVRSKGTSAPAAGEALQAFSNAARRRMGLVTQAVFQAGDGLQDEWLDALPRTFDLDSIRKAAARLASDASASLRVMAPGVGGTSTRLELLDKMEVYLLVRRASRTGARIQDHGTFEELVERAHGLRAGHSLWILEGLAHGYVLSALRDGSETESVGLLVDLDAPEPTRILLHLGLGMALGEFVFGDIVADDPAAIRRALDRFVHLCRFHSMPGHDSAAVEALGLVLRCFFPELVEPVGRAARGAGRQDLPLADYFWHGVGRAVYFLPLHLLPGYGTVDAALRRLGREIPGTATRDLARSGVAYAATLVNLRRPLVLQRFVVRRPEAIDRSFVEGVASALRLRRLTSDSEEVEGFLNSVPASPEDQDAWRERLVEPVRRLLGEPSREVAAGGETLGVVYRTVVESTAAESTAAERGP